MINKWVGMGELQISKEGGSDSRGADFFQLKSVLK